MLATETRYQINEGSQGTERLFILRQENKIILRTGAGFIHPLPWHGRLEDALKGPLTLTEDEGWQVNGRPLYEVLEENKTTRA